MDKSDKIQNFLWEGRRFHYFMNQNEIIAKIVGRQISGIMDEMKESIRLRERPLLSSLREQITHYGIHYGLLR
jgi:hypothetical protein